MRTSRRATILHAVLALAAGAALSASAASSGGVDEAIALYHGARYVEALEVLDQVEATTGNGSSLEAADRDAVDFYRALCLFALDREAEARAALRRLVERRPDHAFSEDDLPPRVLAAARETQADVLPALARAEYRAGKASYDLGLYAEAEKHLRTAVTLARSDTLAPQVRESLGDLAEVAGGFVRLIETVRMEEVPALPPATPAPPPGRAAPYTAADRDVVPPAAVRQDFPNWRMPGTGTVFQGGPGARGRLEVVIDENGRVQSARIVDSVNPLYDSRLLAAARRWEYRPATRDGQPVRFVKVLEVQLVDERRE